MKDYGDFHDGALEGIWVDDSDAYVFLSTFKKERFAAVANGVVALAVTDFRKGNLIFEVLTRTYDELTIEDIAVLHYLREGEEGRAQAAKLLSKAQQEQLSALEINPSYGATCLLLARSIEIIDRNEWYARYLSSATSRQMG